jgi:preprotein translocase subunit SecA
MLFAIDDERTFKETIRAMFDDEIDSILSTELLTAIELDDQVVAATVTELGQLLPLRKEDIHHLIKDKESEKLKAHIITVFDREFAEKEKAFGGVVWKEIVKSIFLSTIDKYWTDHLTAIEDLREGINLRGYAQLDPLVEYKNEAYSLFEKTMGDIPYEATRKLFRVEAVQQENQPKNLVFASAGGVNAFGPQPTQNEQQKKPTENKPGRNEPCWCGSGKKYKKCHWPN